MERLMVIAAIGVDPSPEPCTGEASFTRAAAGFLQHCVEFDCMVYCLRDQRQLAPATRYTYPSLLVVPVLHAVTPLTRPERLA